MLDPLRCCVVSALFGFVCVLVAVRFRQGRWLALIAGNNLVGEEESKSPGQRELGRRASWICFASAGMCAMCLPAIVADELDSDALAMLGKGGIALFLGMMAVSTAYLWAHARRLGSERPSRDVSGGDSGRSGADRRGEDAGLDKWQERVVLVMVGTVLVLEAFAIAWAASH